MGKLKTAWTAKAKTQLKQIYDYLKTPQVAANVKADLIQASKGVTYAEQYQKDDIDPNYRRIVVRHYKLIYKEENGKIEKSVEGECMDELNIHRYCCRRTKFEHLRQSRFLELCGHPLPYTGRRRVDCLLI